MFLRPVYLQQPPAWFYPRILVGAGEMLSQGFSRKYGITHVINCAFPLQSNILDWYPKFEETLTAFLRAPGSGTVFVHCQCGINRSAFLALTYSTTHFNMPYESTFVALKRQRPCMLTNPVFRKQTEEFVNGRVPNSQDPGRGDERIINGDTGLCAPGAGPGFAGFGC
jgi:hypothetical protein